MRFLLFAILILGSVLSGQELVEVIKKAEWGGKAANDTMKTHSIRYITVHHGGVFVGPEKDPNIYLQNLQRFSTEEKGWIDIPYHYLIDMQGRVYEARPEIYPGDTNTEYDPGGHLLICVIGNYEEQQPDSSQIDALARLIAQMAQKYALSLDSLASHKDYSSQTVCPGKNLYAYLKDGSLKQKASAYLRMLRKEKTTP